MPVLWKHRLFNNRGT